LDNRCIYTREPKCISEREEKRREEKRRERESRKVTRLEFGGGMVEDMVACFLSPIERAYIVVVLQTGSGVGPIDSQGRGVVWSNEQLSNLSKW
jgi:hypothetical protein